jgi:hypothetical protein
MTRTLGDEKRGQNFEILATAPIDARLITPTKSSLTSLTGKYNGMICAVNNDTTNNGLYICSQNNGEDDDDWEKVGTTLTSIDADNFTITNLVNANIKSNANISQSKINGLETALSSLTTSVASIPINNNQLANGRGFITSADIPSIPTNNNQLANGSGFITSSDIPSIPTNNNQLANGAAYITASSLPSLTSQLTNDSNFTSLVTSSNIDINNIDCNDINTSGDVKLPSGKKLVLNGGSVDNTDTAGIFWETGTDTDNYAITRTAGAWSGDWQQLKIRWGTGIILDANTAHAKAFVDIQGKMGVNVSSRPSTQFEVNGDSKFTGKLEAYNASADDGFQALETDGSEWVKYGSQNITKDGTGNENENNGHLTINNVKNSAINFKTRNIQRMRLDYNGLLGVGVATPSYALDVAGDINCTGSFKVNGTDLSTGGIGATDDVTCNSITAGVANSNGIGKLGSLFSNGWAAWANSSVFNTGAYGLIQNHEGVTLLNAASARYVGFRLGNTDKMRLTQTGLGIGTDSPTEKLEVNGNIKCDHLNCSQKITLVTNDTSSVNDGGINDYQLKITNALYENDNNSLDLRIGVNKTNLYGFIKVQQNNVAGGKELRLQDNGGDVFFGGQIKLQSDKKLILGGSVANTMTDLAGIHWHTGSDYYIARTSGSWSQPYQQLQLKWSTGIILSTSSSGHDKGFIDCQGLLGVNTTAKPLTQCEVNGVMGVGTFNTASLTNTDVKFIVRREGSNDCFGKIQTCRENHDAGLYLGTTHHGVNDAKCGCLLLAEGKSTWSRSNFHICLNNSTGTNSATADATLTNSRFKVEYNGRVSVGLASGTNADTLFRVNGNIKCTILTETSDDRLKHNETDISNCLATINKLKPQKYIKTNTIFDESGNVYLNDHHFLDLSNVPVDSIWETGYIAQDVREIPELSHLITGEESITDGSGNITYQPLGMSYSGLHAFHTGAIQELHKLVLTLQERIRVLEG